MLICGLDFETTGLNTDTDRITEIGAVLFDDSDWVPREGFSTFVFDSSYPKLPAIITELTGITDAMIEENGIIPYAALAQLAEYSKDAEYFIAHNKNFDEKMLDSELDRQKRQGLPNLEFLDKEFICTATDVPHPKKIKCRTLSHMALDYGVPVNPADLHRAMDDVELMGAACKAMKLNIAELWAFMQIPWVYVEAVIEKPWKDKGRGRDAAKGEGFAWEQPNYYHSEPKFPGKWVKKIKENTLEEARKSFPFPIATLKPGA